MKSKSIQLISINILLGVATTLNAQVTTQWGPDGFIKIEEGSGGFFSVNLYHE